MSSPAVRIGIETSQRSGSIALFANGEVRRADLEDGRRHASDLLPALDRLCKEAQVPTGRELSIDGIAVGVGPGSYTGLRVGIAFALGLLRGARCTRALAVPSGEVLAWSELEVGESATLLLDARQGELYFARYEREAEDVRVLHPPSVIELSDWKAQLPDKERIFGDASVARAAGFDAATEERLAVCPARADALLELAALRWERGVETPFNELEPLYLRPFGNPNFGKKSR